MKTERKDMLLYAVTDRHWTESQSLYEQVELALQGGATFVQLREKDMPEDEFLKEAIEIAALCRKYGVPFVVNDNVAIAKACDADGVHVGQEDMAVKYAREILGEGKIIGVSTHNVEEAVAAEKAGADYLGAGALFPTGTKNIEHNLAIEELTKMCAAVNIPIVAIGGVNENNILQLKGTGISGAAIVSAIFSKQDIKQACVDLKELLKQVVEE